jgi:hypothetical protein
MYIAVADRSLPCVAPSTTALSGETFATFINLAGRRRFTSQRVVLYALLACGRDPLAIGIAKDALALFSAAHTQLLKGGNGSPVFMSPELDEVYYGAAKGNERILEFISLAERLFTGIDAGWRHQTDVLMDELIQSTTPLLATLNALTAIYETEARNHAKKTEHQLLDAMQEINRISKHAQIVALNARIVAACAGPAGREFAVVATELIGITNEIETVLQSVIVK